MHRLVARFKIPRSADVAADMYYEIRRQRYALQAEVDAYKECEDQLRKHFIDLGIPQITGQSSRVSLIPKTAVKITDWTALREYIRRYDAWDLLQLRVNEDVFKKLWAEGKEVPGTEPAAYTEVSAVKL